MSLKEKLREAAVALDVAEKELARAKSAYDSIYRQVVSGKRSNQRSAEVPDSPPEPAIAEVASARRRKIQPQVLAFLEANPDVVFSYLDVAKGIGESPLSVRAALNVLRQRGRVAKPGRDEWILAGEEAPQASNH